MSRHRAIRNLDLEEEFYDEDDGYNYDEIGDISEDDQRNNRRMATKILKPAFVESALKYQTIS
ncbi:hypothetical protein H4217_003311 [Coemansia sp. RSA 1939]|nr:hypothetical protein H4217_003311 [Coemansia sp. RSA 1939]